MCLTLEVGDSRYELCFQSAHGYKIVKIGLDLVAKNPAEVRELLTRQKDKGANGERYMLRKQSIRTFFRKKTVESLKRAYSFFFCACFMDESTLPAWSQKEKRDPACIRTESYAAKEKVVESRVFHLTPLKRADFVRNQHPLPFFSFLYTKACLSKHDPI